MSAIAAIGGSTNGVLHLLALAIEANVDFTLRDVQQICRRVSVYCNFAPRSSGTMVDLHHLGGTAVLLKHLLRAGILNGECMTVTGNTVEENLRDTPDVPQPNVLIAPLGAPWKTIADLQICFGNVAPDGIVFKVNALTDSRFTGHAICFQSGKAVADAASSGLIRPGHVVVLMGLGPKGAGMPEVHVASSALAQPELRGKVVLISDTRVSGVSSGAIGVHCAPEAYGGGPIGLLQDGDLIEIDLEAGSINAQVDFSQRECKLPAFEHSYGYLADFAALTTQANQGCVSKTRVSKK
jgi:dihydroxy-acid dehydratase